MQEARKPLIYLAVILPLLVGGGVYVPYMLVSAYAGSKGIPVAAVQNTAGLLISLPALVLWLLSSLIIANTIIFAVPPLRRISDRYAKAAGRSGFAKSQRELLLMLFAAGVVCVPIIIYGFTR